MGESRVLATTPCPSGGGERGRRGRGPSRERGLDWPEKCVWTFKERVPDRNHGRRSGEVIGEEDKRPEGWGRLTPTASGLRIRELTI